MSSSVSCMSAASLRISGARGSATGAALRSSTGFPIFAMRRTATASSSCRSGVTVASSRILRRRRGARIALHRAGDGTIGPCTAGAGARGILEALLAQGTLQILAAVERALGRRAEDLAFIGHAGGLARGDRAAFDGSLGCAAAVLAGAGRDRPARRVLGQGRPAEGEGGQGCENPECFHGQNLLPIPSKLESRVSWADGR